MKFSTTLLHLALVFTTSAAPTNLTQAADTAPTGSDNTQLIADLAVLPLATDRLKKLFVDPKTSNLYSGSSLSSKIVFDYNAAKPAGGALGGRTVLANTASFPVLRGVGLATAVVFLDACGINTPHVHPRASEMITVASGTLFFGTIFENGVVPAGSPAEVNGTLTQYQGTVFPQGSIHYQANPTCDQTVYVQTLNSDDPGTNSVAQSFFGLNGEVVQASLGWPANFKGSDLELFRSIIPATLAARVESCLETCGIAKK